MKPDPQARERLARHLFIKAHGEAWAGTAALAWDRRAEYIDFEVALAEADEILAVIAGEKEDQ